MRDKIERTETITLVITDRKGQIEITMIIIMIGIIEMIIGEGIVEGIRAITIIVTLIIGIVHPKGLIKVRPRIRMALMFRIRQTWPMVLDTKLRSSQTSPHINIQDQILLRRLTTKIGVATTKIGVATTKIGAVTTKVGAVTTKVGVATTRIGATTMKGITTTE